MKKKLALMLVLVIAMLCGAASAAVEPGKDFYYLDTADVLSTEAEGTIYFCNQLLEEACGGQIVVAALDSIGGEDTYDYAYELFNEWGIGSAEENNGFLLLMAIEEDDYFTLSGAGVDRIFSSGELDKLFDKYLEPYFAKKDYETGALKFFEAVLDKYIDLYNLDFSFADGKEMALSHLSQYSSTDSVGGYDPEYGVSGHDAFDPEPEHGMDGFFTTWITIAVIIVIAFAFLGVPSSRGRKNLFWFMLGRMGAPRHHHHHHTPPRRSGFNNRRPPRSGGGFGGGFGGGGRSGGGFSGSFGGGRGGGGRSFGGGAGRGRR